MAETAENRLTRSGSSEPWIRKLGQRICTGGRRFTHSSSKSLLGSRFVDVPLRVLALMLGTSSALPSAAESSEPLYLVLFYLSSALIILAAFYPGRSAVAGVGLFVAHLILFPEFLNPLQDSLEFTYVVLLATGRWRSALGVTASAVGLTWLGQSIQPEVSTSFIELTFSWGLSSVLAFTGLLLEHRIRQEIRRRETVAIEYEQDMQRLRLQLAVDAHDTISHSLATQNAVIKVLTHEDTSSIIQQGLGELAMLNEQAQQDLRALLHRLRQVHSDVPPTLSSRQHLSQALDSLIAAADAGGYAINLRINDIPEELDAGLSGQILSIVREMVTNIVKHSDGRDDCSISICFYQTAQGIGLKIAAGNPASTDELLLPYTVSARAENMGGECWTTLQNGRFVVTVSIPPCSHQPKASLK